MSRRKIVDEQISTAKNCLNDFFTKNCPNEKRCGWHSAKNVQTIFFWRRNEKIIGRKNKIILLIAEIDINFWTFEVTSAARAHLRKLEKTRYVATITMKTAALLSLLVISLLQRQRNSHASHQHSDLTSVIRSVTAYHYRPLAPMRRDTRFY